MQSVSLSKYNDDESLDEGGPVLLEEMIHIFNEYLDGFEPPYKTSTDALVNSTFYASRSDRDFLMVDIVDYDEIHISSDRLIYSGWLSKLFSASHIHFSATSNQVVEVLTDYFSVSRKDFEDIYATHYVANIQMSPKTLNSVRE